MHTLFYLLILGYSLHSWLDYWRFIPERNVNLRSEHDGVMSVRASVHHTDRGHLPR